MLEYPCIPRYSFDERTLNGVCEASSDKPSDADNQQERLIGWITGFVDGEGCFSIHFVRQPERANRRGYKTGFQVGHEFAVTQGAKSVECLRMLKEFFGVGEVYLNRRFDNHKEHLYRYSVARRSDLLRVIIPFFQRYPLRTSKRADFAKFVECMKVIEMNAHLAAGGLLKVIEIAQTMNHCKLLRRCGLLGGISLLSPEYLLSVERWPFHTEPPDHYDLLSHLLDLSVSQLSTLMPLHSNAR